MAAEVQAAGNTILLNSPVIRLERDASTGGRINRVVYLSDGREHAIEAELPDAREPADRRLGPAIASAGHEFALGVFDAAARGTDSAAVRQEIAGVVMRPGRPGRLRFKSPYRP